MNKYPRFNLGDCDNYIHKSYIKLITNKKFQPDFQQKLKKIK